ncbi:MAG: putative metal-binding motif-containing protein [Deltaproteobacteria bacterium]|nr:putative metal-binding motif-containing protein [Deltaproteobacteria bacterium]
MKYLRPMFFVSISSLCVALAACGSDGGGAAPNPGTGGSGGSVDGGGGAGGTAGGAGTSGTAGTAGTAGKGGTAGTAGTAGTGGTAGGAGTAGTAGTAGSAAVDADGDGYDSTSDCDDNNKDVHPGATEVCNGIDDDCNSQIDEGVATTYYVDADGDAYGVDAPATNKTGCTPPTGYASDPGDCDDASPTVNPASTEICDGLDNNCNSQVDEGVAKNTYYPDADKDGFGASAGSVQACTPPAGDWTTNSGDCDDNDAARYPGNPEVCDGKDNDCDGATPEPGQTTYYQDADGDGFGNPSVSQTACAVPAGYVTTAGDCDDTKVGVNPNAIEICDGIDNNCVGGVDEGPVETWPDVDHDTYGDQNASSTFLCAANADHVTNNSDCNDTNAAINPAATEIPSNGVDENCDGTDTTAGTLCGHDSAGVTTLPWTGNNFLSALENYAGNPAGAGFYWDDYEIATTAGLKFTSLMHARDPATLRPRMYIKANACGTTGFTSNNVFYSYHPGSPYHRARLVVDNAAAGYYYQVNTSNTVGQTGEYDLAVYPGDLGGSCGGDDMAVWPLGWREAGTLATNDTQTGTPVPAGFYADDYEFWLDANQTYTLLYGGMTYSERMYLAKAGACGTSLGNWSTGILLHGAKHVYTPTTAGIYVAYVSTATAGLTGAYTFNVVPGNVGDSCFTGAGAQGGTGDNYVIYPLGGVVNDTLAIGDRVDQAVYGTRFFDDYETWLEAGQSITVTMTSAAFTPRLYLTRSTGCTTTLASAIPASGTTATMTYVVPTAGIYTIVATSRLTSNTGAYSLATQYN